MSPKPSHPIIDLFRHTVLVSILTYVGFFTIDRLNAGFVSNFFPMNWLLWPAVILGSLYGLVPRRRGANGGSRRALVFHVVLAITAGLVVGWWIHGQAWGTPTLSWLMGALVSIIVAAVIHFERYDE